MLQLADEDPRLLALQKTDIVGVLLVAIDPAGAFLTEPAFFCDAPHDVTLRGRTYVSTPDIISASPPPAGNQPDRDLFQIILAEREEGDTWFELLTGRVKTGITVEVAMTFLYNGAYTEPLNVYRGGSQAVEREFNEQGVSVRVTFSGELAQLDGEAAMVTTPDNQAIRDLTGQDTCFNDVGVIRDLAWGRAS